MVLALIIAAVIGAVALTERSVEQLPFAVAALFLSAALLLIFVGDLERAILLSGLLALAFAGAVPFLILQYPRMMLGVLLGGISLVAASIAILLHAAGPPMPPDVRAILLSLALIGFATIAAKAASQRPSLTERR